MCEKKKIIAIIPARSGSKGLKDKNIKKLNGMPLMGYTIEAAIKSGIFDTVHVSTDSKVYAEIAMLLGADEPFLRDAMNSGDAASSWDAVREVIRKYDEEGKRFDICVLLQPTSPLRDAEDICKAYELYESKGAASLTSVTELDHPVQWSFALDDTLFMKEFAVSPYKDCRRQELQKHYRENGAIYIVSVKDIMDKQFDFYSPKCVAYIMERQKSIDIDTIHDFVVAESLLKMSMEE